MNAVLFDYYVGASIQKRKRTNFRFYYASQATFFSGNSSGENFYWYRYVKNDACCLAFTAAICVSIAVVVRDRFVFSAGEPLDLWHDTFRLCSAIVMFSVIAIVSVGLRERFLLAVGMSFLSSLLRLV